MIDIGSNSVRMTAVRLADADGWKVLAEDRDMTRLADGLASTGSLSPESMARSIAAVERFRRGAVKAGATRVLACATAAVRDAGNREDFVTLVRERAGLDVEILSEADEGRLTFASVSRSVDLSTGVCVVADIGGGSLEVVISHDGVVSTNVSLPLGAVRLTEEFGGPEASSGPRRKEMVRHVDRLLGRALPALAKRPRILVGCGGAFTTLTTMSAAAQGLRLQAPGRKGFIHLASVRRAAVRTLLKTVRAMTVQERLHLPGLPPDRADIIVAGLTVIDRLMKRLGVLELRPHGGGVREGMILRVIARAGARPAHGSASAATALRSARDLAARCPALRDHADHVATLALSIYDQLRRRPGTIEGLGSAPRERLILEAACLLHDVGQLVEYRRHHHHSAAIIRNADLPGFSPREVELLALLARYHRKAPPPLTAPTLRRPDDGHAFAVLSDDDHAMVRRLCAIMRVADGLDRAHARRVRGVRVDAGSKQLRLRISGSSNPRDDAAAGTAKADLLAEMTGRRVRILADPDSI